jgi:acetyl-CoA carboxylase biotin carboxyl carrier protein
VIGKPDLDEKLLQKLVKALDEYDLTEIEVGEGRHRLRISRAPAPAAPAPAAITVQPAAAVPTGDDAAKAHPGAVSSPMVGTVYIAPEPGANPFVKVGDTVKAGDTLLLIEAMKTMNPIRAPRAGKITQILVTNAAPVEYGEVLLIIE